MLQCYMHIWTIQTEHPGCTTDQAAGLGVKRLPPSTICGVSVWLVIQVMIGIQVTPEHTWPVQ
jgi:hypothetical protein